MQTYTSLHLRLSTMRLFFYPPPARGLSQGGASHNTRALALTGSDVLSRLFFGIDRWLLRGYFNEVLLVQRRHRIKSATPGGVDAAVVAPQGTETRLHGPKHWKDQLEAEAVTKRAASPH